MKSQLSRSCPRVHEVCKVRYEHVTLVEPLFSVCDWTSETCRTRYTNVEKKKKSDPDEAPRVDTPARVVDDARTNTPRVGDRWEIQGNCGFVRELSRHSKGMKIRPHRE